VWTLCIIYLPIYLLTFLLTYLLTYLHVVDVVFVAAVLKSDNANGLFGFDGPCEPAVVPMSVNELNCTVHRDRGTYDTATVHWLVAPLDASAVSVSQYFINYTGRVMFSAEQTTAVSLF